MNVRMCPCCLSLSVEPFLLFLEWYFKQQMFWVLKQVGFDVCTHTHTHTHNELLVVRWVFFYILWWCTEKERRKHQTLFLHLRTQRAVRWHTTWPRGVADWYTTHSRTPVPVPIRVPNVTHGPGSGMSTQSMRWFARSLFWRSNPVCLL